MADTVDPTAYSREKQKNALLYFIGHTNNSKLGKTKLLKLLYFLDFGFFEKHDRSVTGDVYRKQWAFYVQDGIKFPFQIGLGDNAPYKKGSYQLAMRGFGTNRYHKLELSFVAFEPLSAVALKATG